LLLGTGNKRYAYNQAFAAQYLDDVVTFCGTDALKCGTFIFQLTKLATLSYGQAHRYLSFSLGPHIQLTLSSFYELILGASQLCWRPFQAGLIMA
jgi:hypothetical protein